jgi:hypothetical protein
MTWLIPTQPTRRHSALATAPRFQRAVGPLNVHLLHDIGAFNFGLGATLLLALAWADALLVVLAGVGLGATAHALAHWLDRELGGSAADPWYLSAFALVLLAAAAWRWRELRR